MTHHLHATYDPHGTDLGSNGKQIKRETRPCIMAIVNSEPAHCTSATFHIVVVVAIAYDVIR